MNIKPEKIVRDGKSVTYTFSSLKKRADFERMVRRETRTHEEIVREYLTEDRAQAKLKQAENDKRRAKIVAHREQFGENSLMPRSEFDTLSPQDKRDAALNSKLMIVDDNQLDATQPSEPTDARPSPAIAPSSKVGRIGRAGRGT